MKYRVIDISGDVGLEASGKSLKEAFINIGLGMYSLLTDLQKIECKQELTIKVSAETVESLLINFLNELIFHFDAYSFIGSKIEVTDFSNNHIDAKIYGDYFDPSKHSRGLLIKAATYHNLSITKVDDLYNVIVIFDI
ncbi:MAG: archease [Thermodesulfovibrionales bacterium]|nr:archease [Thermodesulfovibrionales bacterium]